MAASPPAGAEGEAATPGRAAGPIWVRALRLHQWSKNALLLVPAFAAHLSPTPRAAADLLAAFLSFSLLASALYLLNDLVDLRHDRAHPVRRSRPLASGELPVAAAPPLAVLLVGLSFALAWTLPAPFRAAWGGYLVLSSTYSLAFKRVVVLDVIVLAALYALRVVAGAAAIEIPLSRWFLAFSVFVFLSLALLKRLVEIQRAAEREAVQLDGRGWTVADAPVLLAFGAAAAAAAALVYCLYITGTEVLALYSRPDLLWLGLPLLLYWLARVWLLAYRGAVNDDPILFALKDAASYLVVGIFAAIVWAAS